MSSLLHQPHSMAKRQKLSSYQLDDLPDEVILKMLGFLNIEELLLCGQVSKRLQAIANDESLWLYNLYERKVPYDFIEKAAGNGCQYLSLAGCNILHFTGKSKTSFKLKYLNVSRVPKGVQELVQNCSALQKLSVAGLTLDSDDIQYICQNSKTLQVLDLADCKFDLHELKESQIGQTLQDLELEYCNFVTKLFQDLLTNCAHLTELNIGTYSIMSCDTLLDRPIHALVDNLTRTILKVNLRGQDNLQDEHVKKLIKRCNNITHLDLSGTSITNDSMHSIIEHLKTSLEELNVSSNNVDFASLFQLKSMPTLKTLICDEPVNDISGIENLKQQLRHISINDIFQEVDLYYIASPFKRVKAYDNIDKEWIWEIRANRQDLFAKLECNSDNSDDSNDSNDSNDSDDSDDSDDE